MGECVNALMRASLLPKTMDDGWQTIGPEEVKSMPKGPWSIVYRHVVFPVSFDSAQGDS